MRNNLRLSDAMDRYMERMKNSGAAETTTRTTYYVLRRLRLTLTGDPLVHTVTADTMDRYCYGPEGIRRDVNAHGFNRYRSALRGFFEYCLQMRWTDVNPMDGIERARPDAPKDRLMLNASELITLLEYTGNPVERIACSLGMNTGLRANDIRRLTIFDASLASGLIQTEIRKVKKLDSKPITMELHWELKSWLNQYRELMGQELESDWLLTPSYHLFHSRDGKRHFRPAPLRVHQAPWNWVKRPLEKMGYSTKGEGMHTLRRSSARALFESLRSANHGRDHALMVVKEFLNHASTAQTEHYLGLNQERVLRDEVLKDKSFLPALVAREQKRLEGLA